jgi:hypothetical protein
MSEPSSASDPTPEVPKAPSFTYGSPAAAPAAPADQLPPPQYGERLPAPAGPPAPGAPPAYGVGSLPAPAVRRRTWDVVLTVILLVLGFFGMLIGLFYAWAFSSPELIDEAMGQGGMGGFDGTIGAGPTIIAVSHVVLYLVALGVGILLLVKNKVAFWVPLAAGVIAAIVFWASLSAILLSDPDLISNYYR